MAKQDPPKKKNALPDTRVFPDVKSARRMAVQNAVDKDPSFRRNVAQGSAEGIRDAVRFYKRVDAAEDSVDVEQAQARDRVNNTELKKKLAGFRSAEEIFKSNHSKKQG